VSARIEVEGVPVNAPLETVIELLLNVGEVMSRAPGFIVRRWDPSRRVAEIVLRRLLSGFREVFGVSARREGNHVVYTFTSARTLRPFESYEIIVRFQVSGSGGASRVSALVEGEGLDLSRFRGALEGALRLWLESIRGYIEGESARLAASRVEPPRSPTGQGGVSQAVPPASEDPLREGSVRLGDPIFEAEVILRGQLVYTGSMVVGKIAEIVDLLQGALESLEGTYVIKISFSDREFSLLLENGRLTGALMRGYREALGLEALRELQDLLPAGIYVTVMKL